MQQTQCNRCGRAVPGYDIINYGSMDRGYRELCTKCFNTEAAASGGLDKFEHAELAPVQLADCDGETHLFHFRARLIEKIRRALSTKHVREDSYGLRIADHQVVRGWIDWDEFGRMLISFEGWQFKLEIRDRSEEL